MVRASYDNGATWNILSTSETGTSMSWTVPEVDTAEALIKVNAIDGNESFLALDISDAPFAITSAAFAVTAPNGGETLTAGDTATVSWNAKTGAARYVVRVSYDNGATWTILSTDETGTSMSWSVPAVDTAEALVRVNAVDAENKLMEMDISDAPFSVTSTSFAVTAPNGGEELTAGDTVTVSWNAKTGAGHYVVRVSYDYGATWAILSTDETGTSMQWTIPEVDTAEALVRVNAVDGVGLFLDSDVSDAPFSISTATFAVTAPNGGEALTKGSTTTISWTSKAGAARYVVRYSIDNGAHLEHSQRQRNRHRDAVDAAVRRNHRSAGAGQRRRRRRQVHGPRYLRCHIQHHNGVLIHADRETTEKRLF